MKTNLTSILWGGLLCLLMLAGCGTRKMAMTTKSNNLIDNIYVEGSGTATVNWGDGTTEDYTLTVGDGYSTEISHNYAVVANYTITIAGKNITSLISHNDLLTSLDMSGCPALTYLQCEGNNLTSLDVSGCPALTYLQCDDNNLTSLDVSSNTALRELICESNELTYLDVSKNTALRELICESNELTSLDVSRNAELTGLDCGYNQLASLDVSKNTALEYLSCDGNQLTSLDVSKNTALIHLECIRNQLTSLNVSSNTVLSRLSCGANPLMSPALNALFSTLHNNRLHHYLGSLIKKRIYIRDNPGTGTCDKSIATAKGWEVNTTYYD